MHHRILGVTAAGFAALLLAASLASAAELAKGTARAKAQQTAAQFAAGKTWAKAARLGKCERAATARIVCLGRVIGPQRNCRVRVVVWKGAKVNARLHRGRCSKTSPELLATIQLSARLSSVPRRNLSDPFEATYDYSAGATAQRAAIEEQTEPPAGVLALYVDGVLECAENISQAKPESECPVEHDSLGKYRVTTIYTSGNESATDTMQFVLEPLPTNVDISVSYEPLAVARYLAVGCGAEVCKLEEGHFGNADIELGTLHVSVTPISPWGTPPAMTCTQPEMTPLPDCLVWPDSGSASFPVVVLADLEVPEEQVLVEGELINAEMLAPEDVVIEGATSQLPASVVQSGQRYLRAYTGFRAGYLASEDREPLKFAPVPAEALQFR